MNAIKVQLSRRRRACRSPALIRLVVLVMQSSSDLSSYSASLRAAGAPCACILYIASIFWFQILT